jgi:hypothetical protein
VCVCVCVCVCVDTAAGFITSPCNVRSNALSCGIALRLVFYGYTQTSRKLTGGSLHKACSISVPFKINRHFSYERKNNGLKVKCANSLTLGGCHIVIQASTRLSSPCGCL